MVRSSADTASDVNIQGREGHAHWRRYSANDPRPATGSHSHESEESAVQLSSPYFTRVYPCALLTSSLVFAEVARVSRV